MIKKIALMTSLLSTLTWAEAPKTWQNDFTLGVEAQHYQYEEPLLDDIPGHGKTWMNQKGYLFGVDGSYRLTYGDLLFAQGEGRLLIGKERYEAGLNEETRNFTKRTIKDLIAEPRFLIGGHVHLYQKVRVSPYAGLGYRLKIDDCEKTRDSSHRKLGPYRKSNYVYIPVGSYLDLKVDDQWSFSIKGEYDYLLKGWQYDRRYRVSPVEMKQKKGYGLKGELMVHYQTKYAKLSVGPYFNYWNIKESNKAYVWYEEHNAGDYTNEPHNTTLESGMRFGVSF